MNVTLEFDPPDATNIVALRIYESADKENFSEIQRTTAVGTSPDYITHFTTPNASSLANWYSVKWENSLGVLTDLSNPIQGYETTVVGEIVRRALLRDPSLNEVVISEEAEAVVEEYFGSDPYDAELAPTRAQYSGLTLLAMGRALLARVALEGTTTSFTAGLVSLKNDTSQKQVNITDLISLASRLLGINRARVGHIIAPVIAGGLAEAVALDQSRLVLEIE